MIYSGEASEPASGSVCASDMRRPAHSAMSSSDEAGLPVSSPLAQRTKHRNF